MRSWFEAPAAKWVIMLFCLACMSFAAWRMVYSLKGPTPAKVDPNASVPWGRPHGK